MKIYVFGIRLLSVLIITSAFSFGSDLIRMGSHYGGWTIPKNLLTKNSICYCVGAGEDITFDIALIREYGCKVYSMDPTPRAIEHVTRVKNSLQTKEKVVALPEKIIYAVSESILNNLFFVPLGLWHENKTMKFYAPNNALHVSHSITNIQKTSNFFIAKCTRLSLLMRSLGHKKLDLLKLDIEGAECMVIDTIIQDKLDITCICVEFDEIKQGTLAARKKVENCIKALCAYGYNIIYRRGFVEVIFLKRSEPIR